MPPVITAAIISATGVAAGGFAALAINVVVGVAFSSVVNMLFGKKPEQPENQSSGFTTEPRDRNQTFRSSIAERRVVYGRVKVSGPLIFAASTGDANKLLHMVVALANHEVTEIQTVYLDDKLSNDSSFGSNVAIFKHLGTDTQTSDGELTGKVAAWTSDHRLQGVAYVYAQLTYDQNIFPNGAPNTIAAIIRGKALYDFRTDSTAFSENPALMIYDYLRSSTYGMGADTTEIDTVSFTAAANVCDERVLLTAQTKDFTVSSVPNDTLLLADVNFDVRMGDGVRLTSTGTLPGGLSLATTYYVIESTNSLIQLATTYANAIASVAINITDAGTGIHTLSTYDQMRYNANGTVALNQKPIDIIEQMLTSMGGSLVYSQGQYRLFAAAYSSSVISLDEDNLIGAIGVRPSQPRQDLFNAVRGTFVDPSKAWQPTDFPLLTNSTYQTEDGGEQIFRDIELAYTINAVRAQRIAKIHLEKSRQGITVDMPCDMSVLKVAVSDTVSITNTYLGWSSKEFKVINWQLNAEGGINLTLQEESSASYDWAMGDATNYDTAPNTTLPSPTTVTAPGNPTVVEDIYETTQGSGVKTRVTVAWMAPLDGFVIQFEAQYKKSSDSTWQQIGTFPSSVTSAVVPDLEPDVYDFRVRSINGFGVQSSFGTTSGVQVFGLTAAPADITNFSLNAINNNAHLSWTQATDLDVKIGGRIRLRYSTATSSATWSAAIDLGESLPGIATNATVPLMTGSYLIKAVDSTGNESANAAVITTTVANITKMNVMATATENPTFSGTKTNTVVSDSVLRISGSTLFDSATGNFDDAGGLFDFYGGNLISGTYRFAAALDTGKVSTSRVTATIAGLAYDSTTVFDQKAGFFDDANGLFDGADISFANAALYVRTTNDDPLVTGGASWSDWRQFYVGDYVCRAYDFELRLSAENESYNIDISTLSVSVDVPDITDAGSLTTSAVGATTVSFNKTFFAAPNVGITVGNGATGDFIVLSSTTSSSFSIGVKNAAGSFVARAVTWLAAGY